MEKTATAEGIDKRMKILDFYGSTEIVFAVGPFVGGVHEAENKMAGEKTAAIFLKSLADKAGEKSESAR